MLTTIKISGTHCKACKMLIEDIAKDIKGISTCEVDPQEGVAQIEYASDADLKELKKEVESIGRYNVIIE